MPRRDPTLFELLPTRVALAIALVAAVVLVASFAYLARFAWHTLTHPIG